MFHMPLGQYSRCSNNLPAYGTLNTQNLQFNMTPKTENRSKAFLTLQVDYIFQLLSLATMFQKVTGMQRRTNLSPIGERYALVLQRRLVNDHGYKTGMVCYQQFVQGLDIVREFAALLQRVFSPR